jgi:hypothetical protein
MTTLTPEDRARLAVLRADMLKPGHMACDSCLRSVAWLLALVERIPGYSDDLEGR